MPWISRTNLMPHPSRHARDDMPMNDNWFWVDDETPTETTSEELSVGDDTMVIGELSGEGVRGDQRLEGSGAGITWGTAAPPDPPDFGQIQTPTGSSSARAFRFEPREPVLTGMAAGCKKLPTYLYSRNELRTIRNMIFFQTTNNGVRRTVRNMIKLLVDHRIYREDNDGANTVRTRTTL